MKLPKELLLKKKKRKKAVKKKPRINKSESDLNWINPSFLELTSENPTRSFYKEFESLDSEEEQNVDIIIINYIKSLEIVPAEYNPIETQKILNQLYKLLYLLLVEKLKETDYTLLFHAYRQLEYVEGQKHKLLEEIHQYRDEISQNELVSLVTKIKTGSTEKGPPIRFIIDLYLRLGKIEGTPINKKTWSFIFFLSLNLNNFSTISEYIHYGLSKAILIINEDYSYDLKPNIQFDMDTYERVFSKRYYEGKFDINNIIFKEIPPSFKLLNGAFKQEFGFTFTNLYRSLNYLGRMNISKRGLVVLNNFVESKDFPIIYIYKDQFLDGIKKTWEKKIDTDQILKIINFLSQKFQSQELKSPIVPSHLIGKEKRIIYFPIITSGNSIMYANESCLLARDLWGSSILAGIFPIQLSDNSPVKKALNVLHSEMDKDLEIKSGNIAEKTLGKKYVEIRINNFKRLSINFPRRPDCGEIDFLAVNKKIKKLFLMDAKNYSIKISGGGLNNIFSQLFDKNDGDIKHLNEKVQFISENLQEILDYFKIQDKTNWNIIKGFIFKEPLKIAYIHLPEIEFVLIDDLADFLKN
jgi:hypothetical protein